VRIGGVEPAIIYEVASNSPAAVAGLKKGDEIIAINKEKVYSLATVIYSMTNLPSKPVSLTIKRGREQFDKELLAEKPLKPEDSPPSFGITTWQGNTNEALVHPGPVEQIQASAMQIFQTVRVVFSPKTDVGVQQLGGPVMIIRLYSTLFGTENGWRLVLWFSVLLNVNLALLNLLPFPVLDGGHITLAIVEVIRRRPVSARFLNVVQSACALILIGFMLFIMFFDTSDLVRSAHNDREQPMVFAPKH
jgi:regulator of sigma E protease